MSPPPRFGEGGWGAGSHAKRDGTTPPAPYPVRTPLPRTLLRPALGKPLPTPPGTLPVPGPSAPVTIRRDRHGIPMIDAANEPDAFFALGFCHAQDRAVQLEVLVRLGRGTVAELAGPRVLAVDRVTR